MCRFNGRRQKKFRAEGTFFAAAHFSPDIAVGGPQCRHVRHQGRWALPVKTKGEFKE